MFIPYISVAFGLYLLRSTPYTTDPLVNYVIIPIIDYMMLYYMFNFLYMTCKEEYDNEEGNDRNGEESDNECLSENDVNVNFIGICGPTCSGKSTVSRYIKDKLEKIGISCYIISQDNYYHGGNPTDDYDDPSAIEFSLLKNHLKSLREGRTIQMPQYDFGTHSRKKETITVRPTSVIIVEGILIFTDEDVRNILDRKVYIYATNDNCRLRRVNRDVRERQRTEESVIEQYDRYIIRSNERHVYPSRDYADIILNNNAEFKFMGLEIFKCALESPNFFKKFE